MSRDPATNDAVVEVNFAARALRERPPSPLPPSRHDPSLVDVVHVLLGNRWNIAATVAVVLGLAAAYLLVADPVYESSVVLQLEDKTTTARGLEGLSDLIGEAATPAETEIQVIQSRAVIDAVVGALGLDVQATPRRMPVLGAAVARMYRGEHPAPVRLGLARYGWGGERIRIHDVDVSDDLIGDPMLLTTLGDGRYRIAASDGGVLLEAAVGEPASGGQGKRRIDVVVSELVARPGTEFLIVKRSRADVASAVRSRMHVRETGRQTGVLVVTLEGDDPRVVADTLNAIAKHYVRRNVERKSAEAGKMLSFLESQLPLLKANVERSETALNEFQRQSHTVNVTQQTQALLDRATAIETTLTNLQLQLTELRQRFTENHPAVVSMAQRIAQLRSDRAALEEQLRALPETERDSARLQRDVQVASELYGLLMNKTQELKVAQAGVIGIVSILDDALAPRESARPKPGVVMSLALLLGLGLGIALAFVRNAFRQAAEDPADIEAQTGLAVFATLPHSDVEDQLERKARRDPGEKRIALAAAAPADSAIEALRIVRTALQFALRGAGNNVVALGAPTPAAGKSFVSVNLAHLLAAEGRRVLLIDGDLRRGELQRYFSLDREPGLSDVLSGTSALEPALRSTGVTRLDVLTNGRIPPNPAELLASERFHQLLSTVAQRYDLVIVDTPPVLAVTDPSLVARHAGVNLLVLRSGRHPIHEIELARRHLERAGVDVQGAILNDACARNGGYGRGGRFQRYEHHYKPGNEKS